ncbi:hypothetical protein SNE40_012893 [Patella caerulea]|uniref:Uncharacterized protein n=1 Tax=Patella caerulea TaxID=87958 RepID=A0AAN8JIA9_PATCE
MTSNTMSWNMQILWVFTIFLIDDVLCRTKFRSVKFYTGPNWTLAYIIGGSIGCIILLIGCFCSCFGPCKKSRGTTATSTATTTRNVSYIQPPTGPQKVNYNPAKLQTSACALPPYPDQLSNPTNSTRSTPVDSKNGRSVTQTNQHNGQPGAYDNPVTIHDIDRDSKQ